MTSLYQLKEDREGGIIIYSGGICYCSVCTPASLSNKELEERVNALSPTGISSRWVVSERSFATGEPNPCVCEDDPENRKHYLMEC